MSVYMLIETAVVDADAYAQYQARIPAVVAQYGGRYIIRGGPVVPLTGDWTPQRIILLEFETAGAMRAWNESPEYQELAPLRMAGAKTRAVALQGHVDDLDY